MRTVSDLFDLSIHFISISSSLLSSCSSCCLTLSTSLNVVDSKPAHFRWGAGRPSQKELLHSMRKENLGETDDSESEPWYYKLVPRNNEDCGKPLVGEAAESFSSDFQESQRESEATWNNFFSYRHPQVSLRMRYFLWCGISLGISWWRHEWSLCVLGHVENVHENYSSSINFYRQRKWRDFIWIEEDGHE